MNANENTTYQNLCDTLKAVVRGIFTVINAIVKNDKEHKSAN